MNTLTSFQYSVAVITATIGRQSLHRTIQSVQKQTYPCHHYIFVDGEQYHNEVREIVTYYPNITVTYLPMNSGANKMYNSNINAIAPFLVTEDIICYLDDDNWFDENHVKFLVEDMMKYNTDYAYSLRYYVNENEEVICEDNCDSLGFWVMSQPQTYSFNYQSENVQIINQRTSIPSGLHLIDVSCFAIQTQLAKSLALVWSIRGLGNDRQITHHLLTQQNTGICTGKRTLFYLKTDKDIMDNEPVITDFELSFEESVKIHRANFQQRNNWVRQLNQSQNNIFPWEQKTLFKNGQLIVVE